MTEYGRLGSLKRQPVGTLADKAAERIIRSANPRALAVTVDPSGMAAVELHANAVPDDVVGCYDPKAFKAPRWMHLAKQIAEDLRHHWQQVREGVA